MSKHTPGPWKLIEAGGAIGVVPAKRPPGVGARDVEDIATVQIDGEQHDGRANARLIAASPTMFAALQDIIDAHDRHQDDGSTPGDYDSFEEFAVATASAALAKIRQ